MKISKFVAVVLIVFLFGSGYFLGIKRTQKIDQDVFAQIRPVRENNSEYKFINPLLTYSFPDSTQFGEYKELSGKLDKLVDKLKSENKAEQISVYFRGSQGKWVGVNELEEYYPASLMKVVLMIAYYQQAQADQVFLQKKLKYTTEIQKNYSVSEFNNASKLAIDQEYQIDDLIKYMIVDSDNGATFTLINSLDAKSLNAVFSDFGLQAPTDQGNYQISAKDYSLFFRILFNSTYLDREYSEKALALLSQATFMDGLLAGLPENTLVAHKYGEHVLADGGIPLGEELHDCGIIYRETGNYLLCVMTRGKNVDGLKEVIKQISQLVYNETK